LLERTTGDRVRQWAKKADKKSAACAAALNPPKEEGGGDKSWNDPKRFEAFSTKTKYACDDVAMQEELVRCDIDILIHRLEDLIRYLAIQLFLNKHLN